MVEEGGEERSRVGGVEDEDFHFTCFGGCHSGADDRWAGATAEFLICQAGALGLHGRAHGHHCPVRGHHLSRLTHGLRAVVGAVHGCEWHQAAVAFHQLHGHGVVGGVGLRCLLGWLGGHGQMLRHGGQVLRHGLDLLDLWRPGQRLHLM